ncbi:hypothetical protein Y032_0735g1936 [Ancylostoma ceylanicum]|uniref:SSD domain-containing protein n=1 Tax=Ancylostoma ceylanicum TaxID=53326 RepID=A0A016WGR0_9BILA|nr:hypothetical protein Y032_0735g1936 [Ancylostoma ceylanicum]
MISLRRSTEYTTALDVFKLPTIPPPYCYTKRSSYTLSALTLIPVNNYNRLIGVGAILCPLLAITCTYGILSLIGSRVNSLLFVMPFLIMGIGIVYQECGPSITISSLTNVLAFAVGYLTPTPEVQLFCFGTAIAMALTYLFQLILFGPTLAIATEAEQRKSNDEEGPSKWRIQADRISRFVFRVHCNIVSREYIAVFILIATLFYWYYSFNGIFSMKTSLDSVKILPKDSLLHKPNSLLTNYVWKENLILTVFVNTHFNMTDRYLTTQFWDVLKELETLPHCKGPTSSYVWFRNFVNEYAKSEQDYPYEEVVDPSRLDTFFKNDRYHFDTSVKLKRLENETTIESFFITVAYTNVSTWDIRIELMTQWRDITAKYPDLNMTVFEPGGMFVDQMLSLRRVTIQTALLTLFSMTVVCAVFIGRPCSVATASASIASISIGVVGIMSKLSFELDPVVMIALLMTIGMSVDYIAHVAYHFQRDSRNELKNGISIQVALKSMAEKVEHTVLAVAWPMVQAALSTIFCVLPLTFVSVQHTSTFCSSHRNVFQTYSSSVFFTAIFLVVLFGLTHGLIILPAFLSRLPEWLSGNKCCNMKRISGGAEASSADTDSVDDSTTIE